MIRSLRVQHVRTHTDYILEIAPDVTVITGANGSGKTSLLEALYIAMQGSSFKGSDKDVLRRGDEWYRIDVASSDTPERIVKYEPNRDTGRKQFTVEGKKFYRLPQQYRLPVVLFEPDDLRLLHGSPERRRRFIDILITQVDPTYGTTLRRYERVLKQRNILLKNHASQDDFFAWDVSLSEYGAKILEKRQQFVAQLDEKLNDTYKAIADCDDVVRVKYSHRYDGSVQQKLLSELHQAHARDLVLGYTTCGPHRHDILFEFNGSSALAVASRGEVRSIVLALKFLEIDIIEHTIGKRPVVLLDDVFSELDEKRQKHLTTLTKSHQIIITSATSGSLIKTRYITKL